MHKVKSKIFPSDGIVPKRRHFIASNKNISSIKIVVIVTFLTKTTQQVEDGVDVWVWSETRGAYWGSKNNQAILNLCSEGVQAALATAQCAWLKRGIAGVILNPDFPKDQCAEMLLRKMISEAMSCARGASLDTP